MATIRQISKDTRSRKQRQKDFLKHFSECANIRVAAKKAKVSRDFHYDWIVKDEEYRQLFQDACDKAAGVLEDEAVRRAVEGTLKPIYQGGKKVGTVREYSDTLLIVLMKGHMPQKYRERLSTELSGPGGKPIQTEGKTTIDYTQLPDHVLSAIIDAAKPKD